MNYPVFYVPAGDVLPVMFSSYAGATGASITMTGLAVTNIEIYKDGSVIQRASDAGYTLLDTDGIDFDSITGIHGFSIDTGDNTDAGFYTVGAWFTVVVSAVTVDSQTVNFIACQFRLMPAETSAGEPKVDANAAGVRSAVGLAAANLDTQLTAIDDAVDIEVAAIKAKTDQLTFSSGNVSANVLAINGSATAAQVSAILNGSTVVYQGTVTGSATTTTLIDSGLTQSDTDWWKGRIIIFTSVIPLQATDITAFNPVTDQLTFTSVTQAPTSATYVII